MALVPLKINIGNAPSLLLPPGDLPAPSFLDFKFFGCARRTGAVYKNCLVSISITLDHAEGVSYLNLRYDIQPLVVAENRPV